MSVDKPFTKDNLEDILRAAREKKKAGSHRDKV